MSAFAIDVRRLADSVPDAPTGLVIRSHGIVFTRLIRQGGNTPEDFVAAPAGALGFWLVDNWWRLIFECVPSSGQTPEWRLAHDLAAMGGYAWPRLTIWGEGERIGLSSRSDPQGVVGPVRYLTDALTYVSKAAFENAALAFIDRVASEREGLTVDWAALKTQRDTLADERADPELAAWRRLEAQLGYDVDEAPDALMEALATLEREYGAAAVAEAALAVQGDRCADILRSEIEAANAQHWQCDLTRTARLIDMISPDVGEAPWEFGERAAAAVREATGHVGGPLSNAALSEMLQVRRRAFLTAGDGPSERAYGLRLVTGRRRGEIVSLASRWAADRRFEFARALGDAIWNRGDNLGPLTRAKSECQKFQRAFAQSLLCPYDALLGYIGEDRSDGALAAAARHFLVSERVVRTLLVNKRSLERRRLDQASALTAGLGADLVPFEDAVEAA